MLIYAQQDPSSKKRCGKVEMSYFLIIRCRYISIQTCEKLGKYIYIYIYLVKRDS